MGWGVNVKRVSNCLETTSSDAEMSTLYSVRHRKRMGGNCGHVEVGWRRQTDRPTDAPHASEGARRPTDDADVRSGCLTSLGIDAWQM
eukprot:1427475-Prymnesium_polylepis.1